MINVSRDSPEAAGIANVTKISPENRLANRGIEDAAGLTADAAKNADPSNRSVINVAVLGSTGSIGTATAEVISHLNQIDPAHRWRLWAASGHQNLDKLEGLARHAISHRYGLERLVFSDISIGPPAMLADRFRPLGLDASQLKVGAEELVAVARDEAVDVVVAAIVGRAGLESTIAAVESGKRVALANKETLVVAGGLVSEKMVQSGAQLMPVDSEHSAIWQCIADSPNPAKRLILTASGGPFRSASRETMHNATPADALAHPTWQMGRKISIDSATMMNKALEIIEARWLFDVTADQIEVMIHPQSIIHSMVEFCDDSVLAQMSPPDMRLPIQ
ncbi:MAG: hypothetical protein KDB00_07360, partial [Planctomycetales bacterium]|nr:hypothetical protein [Planctomycetales bacterium]